MNIPFITKYLKVKEELKETKEKLKTEKLINEDLRSENDEIRNEGCKMKQKQNRVVRDIRKAIHEQNYGSCPNMANKVESIIKELDVSETY